MFVRIVIGFIYVFTLSQFTRGDSVTNFIILDQNGKNTCIADLECFLSISQKYTLSFDLTLENNIGKTIFTIVIEQVEDADVMKKEMFLSYDNEEEVATLADECKSDAVIPAGTYHINAAISIPVFKDIASMIITGPNGAEGFRNVVSPYSSQPPLQLCNPRNRAC